MIPFVLPYKTCLQVPLLLSLSNKYSFYLLSLNREKQPRQGASQNILATHSLTECSVSQSAHSQPDVYTDKTHKVYAYVVLTGHACEGTNVISIKGLTRGRSDNVCLCGWATQCWTHTGS